MRPLQSTQVDPPYRSICQLLQDQEQGAASSSSLQSVSLSSPPPDDGVTSQPQTQDDFTPAQTFLQQRFATDNGDLFATKPPSPITSNLPQATTKNLLNPQMFAGGGGSGSGGKSTPNAGLGGGGLIGGGGPGLVNANQCIGDNFGVTTFTVSLALTARNSLAYNLLSVNGSR